MKARVYAWLLVLFAAVTVVLLLLLNPWTSSGAGIESILPKNLEGSSRIQITSDTDTLTFEYHDTAWYLGKEKLNQEAVENLLIASTRLSIKSILPKDELSTLNQIAKISFFQKKKLTGEFWFGSRASEFLVFSEGTENFFGVELIGYESYPLSRIFSQNPDHYREHLLIDLLPDEIRSIRVIPLSGKSFRAEQDSSRNIWVKEIPGEIDVTALISEEKVGMLFSYFNAIRYTKILSQKELANARWPETSIADIQVLTTNDELYALEIFAWILKEEEEPDIFRALVRFNGHSEVLAVDYFYLDLIMRGLEKYYSQIKAD